MPTLIDVLINEIMTSAFLAPEARLSLARNLLALRAEFDNELMSRKAPDSNDNYRTEAISAAVLGAAAIGGAAAASSASGSWIPITIVGALGILTLASAQLGGRGPALRAGAAASGFDPAPEVPEVVPLGSLLRGPGEHGEDRAPASGRRRAADGESSSGLPDC